MFECCGTHNYTDWENLFDKSIPDSCCLDYHIGCSTKTAKVHHRGCLQNVTDFVNEEVRCQLFTAKIYCFAIAFLFVAIAIFVMYLSAAVYLPKMKFHKAGVTRRVENDDEEQLVVDDDDNTAYAENQDVIDEEDNDEMQVYIHEIPNEDNEGDDVILPL